MTSRVYSFTLKRVRGMIRTYITLSLMKSWLESQFFYITLQSSLYLSLLFSVDISLIIHVVKYMSININNRGNKIMNHHNILV